MELQVLYDDQTVKYALIFTGFDQSLFRSILFYSLKSNSVYTRSRDS